MIELLIVVICVIILMAISIPSVTGLARSFRLNFKLKPHQVVAAEVRHRVTDDSIYKI